MSKNFNLSIPKKRLRSARFKLGKYFSSTVFSGAALSLVLAGALILPQTAQAADENVSTDGGTTGCTLAGPGTITNGVFTPNESGSDFKITCVGALSDRLDNASIMSIEADLESRGYDPGTSKILLDVDGVTSGDYRIAFVSVAGLNILTGDFTSDAFETDGVAISLMSEDDVDDVNYGTAINAENRAVVTVKGAGRKAFSITGVGGANASFTNHEDATITTSGDVYQRPSPLYEGDKYPNRRSDGVTVETYGTSGHVTLTNHGTVTINAKAAKGLTGGVAGTNYDGTEIETPSDGDVTIDNYGTVTTTGDAYEFPVSAGYPNADKINRDYRPYGVQAYINKEGTGNINITNHQLARVTTEGLGSRGITAYSDGPGFVRIINFGTVTNTGGAWQAESEDSTSQPYGVYGNSAGGGYVMVENYGSVTTGDEMKTKTDRETLGDSIEVSGTQGHALRAITQGTNPGLAEVINHAGGTIDTWGDRAHGMSTWANGNSGSINKVIGTNVGTITTDGDNADGMLILAGDSTDEGSAVTATNSGTITANGDSVDGGFANGISAGFWMDGDDDDGAYSGDALGTVTVTNSGTVEATGEGAAAIAGGYWAAQGNTIENSGDVVINIEDGSTVEASGSNSVAVIADTHGSGNIEINVNNESTTPAEVVEITAGAEDDPFTTDEDERKFGYGIYATANTASSESEDVNDGDDVVITIEGAINTDDSRNIKIQAYGAATDDTSTGIDETKGIAIYADSGDMTKGRSNISITNANVIGGDQGSGYAVIFKGGPGTLTLDNSKLEGDILFTDADDKLIINNSGDCVENSHDDCAQITGFHQDSSGIPYSSAIHFGDGTDVMDINANHFTMDGINITGDPTITVRGDANLDRTLTLRDVRFNANINFSGAANDKLTLTAWDRSSSINGDIDFGGGADDELIIVAGDSKTFDLMGEIKNLKNMYKRGPGTARVNDVVFTGSELRLEDGQLIVSGTLNLGKAGIDNPNPAGGDLIIGDMGKLVFEITGVNGDVVNHGQVIAEQVIFESATAKDHEVFVQLNVPDEKVADVRAALGDGLDVLDVAFVRNFVDDGTTRRFVKVDTLNVMSESTDGSPTKVVGSIEVDANDVPQAAEINPAMIEQTGVAAVEMPMAPTPTGGGTPPPGQTPPGQTPPGQTPPTTSASSGSSGGGGGGGAILGLGLLAVLLNSFVGDDDASASFGDYYFNTPQSAYIASINERGVMTIKETGNQPYQMWIRTGHTAQPMQMTGVSNTGVSGTEVGVNLYNSDTFYINTSVAPNVAAEVGSLNLAGKGEVYSLNSGWRNDRYFAGMRLSHGEFEVNSIVDNPIVNSALISNAKLRNTQAQLRAGMNLGTGALRFTPSAAVQVGTYESSEHVADSPALEAAIPSYAQDYTSVQLGLKMTSDKWLSFSNGSKWKPQLKFDSIHTDSTDAGNLTLRQSDKAGALSFNTNAGLRSMPDVVNSMSFGAKVKSSTNDQAEWKFGFAGLEADGEEYYAAMAAYQLRF